MKCFGFITEATINLYRLSSYRLTDPPCKLDCHFLYIAIDQWIKSQYSLLASKLPFPVCVKLANLVGSQPRLNGENQKRVSQKHFCQIKERSAFPRTSDCGKSCKLIRVVADQIAVEIISKTKCFGSYQFGPQMMFVLLIQEHHVWQQCYISMVN